MTGNHRIVSLDDIESSCIQEIHILGWCETISVGEGNGREETHLKS